MLSGLNTVSFYTSLDQEAVVVHQVTVPSGDDDDFDSKCKVIDSIQANHNLSAI